MFSMTRANKRQRLLEAAELLFYGARAAVRTTIAMIAERADVPVGNVYYYYKTKDSFAEAVVAARAARFEARCETWRKLDPRAAVFAYVAWALEGPAAIARHGCANHALVHDLGGEGSDAASSAKQLVRLERAFVEERLLAVANDLETAERNARLAEWLVALDSGHQSVRTQHGRRNDQSAD